MILRPIRYRDHSEWASVRSRNIEWLSPWDASNPSPTGRLPTFREMVRSLNAQARSLSALPFVITERRPTLKRPVIIGQLTVSTIIWGSAMSASIGYWVDQSVAGRGVAPTAVAMATDHCFRALGLHRMEINIRPENAASLRVVEKLGFRFEGLRRNFLHINGQWADHRSYALTRDEVPDGILNPWLERRAVQK